MYTNEIVSGTIINAINVTINNVINNKGLRRNECFGCGFEQLAEKVFDQLPHAKLVHFVSDSYNSTSIKNIERNRRGSGQCYLVD